MRKIGKEMIQIIHDMLEGKRHIPWNKEDIIIVCDPVRAIFVYLRNHVIAIYDPWDVALRIRTNGIFDQDTKDVLNVVLKAFETKAQIVEKDKKWYMDFDGELVSFEKLDGIVWGWYSLDASKIIKKIWKEEKE